MTSPARKQPAKDRRALQEYVTRQQVADAEVLQVLKDAYKDTLKPLKALAGQEGEGAAVRRDQITLTRKVLRAAIKAIMAGTGAVVFDNLGNMLQAAFDAQQIYMSETIKALTEDQRRSVLATAQAGLRSVESRLTSSKRELSERVHDATALQNGTIDRMVNSHLARGSSARELAKDAIAYVNPDTPGGARYAAMRLARTELNNAFHSSQTKLIEESPFTKGGKWNLSSSHPEPDECDEFAGKVFAKGKIPKKPHPQCLCFMTPELEPLQDFRATLRERARKATQ